MNFADTMNEAAEAIKKADRLIAELREELRKTQARVVELESGLRQWRTEAGNRFDDYAWYDCGRIDEILGETK